ncbi:uncharacterized protein LOC115733421 [Rhodamnia argentea]|uniref:Uncharacterized protein LOC115733421 n=1 Tax=Rhodamnia argentea TaxID=178133 RepID=A0ABM3HEA9_9MYRT|nr:uncharacterized protein LOC115733421 [Rhodamnia argentea]
MAAPDPNARSTEGRTYPEKQVDRAHHLIQKCIDQYMDRDETARKLEVQFRINPHLTRIVWDRLEEDNQEFFQNYYTRLALKRLIVKINELLDQPPRAMDFPLVPAEQQMSTELAETAPQADSPVSITNNENEAQSGPNPVGSIGSEDVVGSDPNLVPSINLAQSPLEGQGMKTNATLDAALTQISQVQNLITGGNHAANFRGHAQPSSSVAGSSSHLDSKPEESGFHSRIMAAPDQNARSTEDDDVHKEIDRAKDMIERCLQLYMNRNETAHTLEVQFGIDPRLTRLTWDKLAEDNPEFFQNYYTRLVLIKQINRFNELLEQQHRAMNIPLVPEQQMSTELAETAKQADSPVSITNNENEAQSDSNPVSSVGSEVVVGFDLNLMPSDSPAQSPLEGQGMKTNAALDSALMQISQVPNLITGGSHTANFRGPAQPSSSMAGSSSHLDSNPEESGFHSRIMAAPDQNARSTEDDDVHKEIDRAKDMIERCLQLYMNRNETAHTLEVQFGIDPRLTRLTWDKLAEDNPEFFQNYYTRLVLIKQINRFNELLGQQHRAMNIPLVPGKAVIV